ncbi:AraC family transcriptional regulator [Nocardia tengchongensis]|uniref:AraC family transcriptional regulator n=1 Tax=Nocardia tengchongensis TaxID=2055889 RepID=UPI0036B46CF4
MNAYEVTVGGSRISTAGASAKESFDLWASILSESMVKCSMEPLSDEPFHGVLDPRVRSEPISIALVANSDTLARRTHRHIASSDSSSVLACLTTAGVCDVRCGGTYLRSPVGTMFVVDGDRPQEAVTTGYQGIIIRVRRDLLMRAAGLREDQVPQAMRFQPIGHEGLVIDYFRRLVHLSPAALGNTAMLDAGIGLLAAGLALGSDQLPDECAANTLLRQQVITFLEAHLSNPELTPDRIAVACGLSRRKLFRIFADIDGGPMMLLRRLRAERARELLVAAPDRTIAAIADACGFTGDRNFYRVFRAETGLTPREYRDHILSVRPAPGSPIGVPLGSFSA